MPNKANSSRESGLRRDRMWETKPIWPGRIPERVQRRQTKPIRAWRAAIGGTQRAKQTQFPVRRVARASCPCMRIMGRMPTPRCRLPAALRPQSKPTGNRAKQSQFELGEQPPATGETERAKQTQFSPANRQAGSLREANVPNKANSPGNRAKQRQSGVSSGRRDGRFGGGCGAGAI